MNERQAREILQAHGQIHVMHFWAELDSGARRQLLADIGSVDWTLLDKLLTQEPSATAEVMPQALRPPQVHSKPTIEHKPDIADTGEQLIKGGQVAVLTVAGGQGTRLGFDGPKGAYPITPVKHKTLFEYFAEFIGAANLKWGCRLPWCIMTGPQNHQATVQFFMSKQYFGLPDECVHFFVQGVMPAVGQDGKVLLADKHRIALAPDGHGGVVRALKRSNVLQRLLEAGVRYCSYFQIDNPLVPPIDPVFIGLVRNQSSEFGSKVVRKAYDDERVGVFVEQDGALKVIEYTQMPEELCALRDAQGKRLYDAANIACHVMDMSFLQQLAGDEGPRIGYHRAHKKIRHIDLVSGRHLDSTAIKFEQFIFDAIPLAKRPLLLEVNRADEFSPVKNAEGVDSPSTARQAITAKALHWLAQCDVRLPADQAPPDAVEISPLFALSAAELKHRLARDDPRLSARQIYLD